MNTPLRLAIVRGLLVSNDLNAGEQDAHGQRATGRIFRSALFRGTDALQFESKPVSRILFSDLQISNLRFEIGDLKIGVAIIPLAQPLPVGSSDLPGGFGRAALITPPYLVLHREEFAWPRVSPRAPVRSYSFQS
jgi:hypothetical protein